jgi:sodium-dependent dicarboxylate transporter 2/3/5
MPAHRLAAVIVLVVVLWLTEAIPLYASALLGCVWLLALRIVPTGHVLRAFIDPVVLLFVGSFMLARAMAAHRLDDRIARAILSHPWVGGSAGRTLWAMGLVAWLLAMWVSITACVALLMPVAVALASADQKAQERAGRSSTAFDAALLLFLVYAASAGAMVTPVGTPPNLIGIAFIREHLGRSLSFAAWMSFGLPVGIVLLLVRYAITRARFPLEQLPGQGARLHDAAAPLGPWTRGQRSVAIAFLAAVAGWLGPGILEPLLQEGPLADMLRRLTPGTVALIVAGALLLLPAGPAGGRVLRWTDALRIDWRTIALFGGGLALGRAMLETGLSARLGSAILGMTGSGSVPWLTGLAIAATTLLSELTSNTAAATMVIPVALSATAGSPTDGLQLAVASTLAASLGFMLPVSTPGIAMVYGSGRLRLTDVVRTGLLIDLTGIAVVWAAAVWLVPLGLAVWQ